MEINHNNKKVWETFYGPNMGYMLDAYDKFKEDPNSVDASIQALFEEIGPPPVQEQVKQEVVNQNQATNIKQILSAMNLIKKIRTFGHLVANIYPFQNNASADRSFLELESYNLTKEDLLQIPAHLIWEDAPPTIENGWEAYEHLKAAYTQSIAYEFGHIQIEEERKWLDQQIEVKGIHSTLSNRQRTDLLDRLIQVDTFEKFLHKTFVGQKRFSIEGIDMLVPMLDKVIEEGCEDGTDNIMIGMAHRGRLNVLAHVLGKPYELIFSEFHHSPNKDLIPSEGSRGINFGWSGDVKYHLGADRKIIGEKKHTVHVNLANNPSHLEFVNPVVQGITRAAQEDSSEAGFPKQNKQTSISVLIHGDAAFPGEGVVAETLNLSKLKGYETGGTIHIIGNNLIGFTTNNTDSRSTKYASDVAKGYEIPIIHVNADDPESCLAVIILAYQYRRKFKKDILIDLVGYRRFGHNEMDDPQVTQPYQYQKINQHPVIAEKYADDLIKIKVILEEEVNEKIEGHMNSLQAIFDKLVKEDEQHHKKPLKPTSDQIPEVNTAVPFEKLEAMNKNLLNWPDTFTVYPKLERILKRRETALIGEKKIEWALAESLAFATILAEGKPIRLTGQDSERGTFAHRHLVLHDYKTAERFVPLHNLPEAKASFSIYNSPLSEAAVLGFEYGYSVQAPNALVMWEAQFGDFVNVAQTIIDQFISAGRAKWGQKSSLVMLLPHGYEGQGPEHSSGRVERFLQSSAENNWIVANVTTAAQYFHLLRRQALISDTDESRPLIIMTPKSLLRHPQSASSSSELSNGRFQPLLEQEGTGEHVDKVKRLVLCTGKVAVDLAAGLEEAAKEDVESLHIARVEQLYPFPKEETLKLIERFPHLEEVVWVQEEPKNMGAWSVVMEDLAEFVPENIKVAYIGRPKRSSPATGEPHIHKQEQAWIVQDALQVGKGGDNQ
ncbi:2-oxoglutarate dehydrogenase E1 component [Fredinandcohnia quinoae]|uniref:2-oxoglutarate dehydrogenase E1 component n=1 Tax=Fredinandcohnia quinoae TaxID=2918902 RepID=A0AAW5E7C9_9BACI|nr:2-oxoglutarate dehydrogenase E1 component [Fredinandcohnia sp. SECRCQ15]MCH1625911.1 2-oxoglutarate dehydrogenase E1 component [Fredinandcohnia sp. SECRCQ15]